MELILYFRNKRTYLLYEPIPLAELVLRTITGRIWWLPIAGRKKIRRDWQEQEPYLSRKRFLWKRWAGLSYWEDKAGNGGAVRRRGAYFLCEWRISWRFWIFSQRITWRKRQTMYWYKRDYIFWVLHGLFFPSHPCSAQYFPSRYSGSDLCMDFCIIRQKKTLNLVIKFVCAGFV